MTTLKSKTLRLQFRCKSEEYEALFVLLSYFNIRV